MSAILERLANTEEQIASLDRLIAVTANLIEEHARLVRAGEERGDKNVEAENSVDIMIDLQTGHMMERQRLLDEMMTATI